MLLSKSNKAFRGCFKFALRQSNCEPEQRGDGSSVFALGKRWVVQFSATHGGWVILFYNRNRNAQS